MPPLRIYTAGKTVYECQTPTKRAVDTVEGKTPRRILLFWVHKIANSSEFKRFEYKQGRHDHAASKIDAPVDFPLQLNMLPYTNRVRSRDSRENMELQRSCVYDLLSVVVHVGEIETGHYTSYCRVGDQVRLLCILQLHVLTCLVAVV